MKKILFTSLLLIACTFVLSAQVGVQRGTAKKERAGMVKVEKAKYCTHKGAFGWDMGFGSISNNFLDKAFIPSFNTGVRYLRNYSPYWGVEFFKVNGKYSFKRDVTNLHVYDRYGQLQTVDYKSWHIQLMVGVRGNTPAFYKCMSGYASVRMGYGIFFENQFNFSYDDSYWDYYSGRYVERWSDWGDVRMSGGGFCYEMEIGIKFTRSFFMGYAYNFQGGKQFNDEGNDVTHYYEGFKLKSHSHSLRIGFNFGNKPLNSMSNR